MPSTFAQWLWFVFYTAGAAGGWVVLAFWAAEHIRAWRGR